MKKAINKNKELFFRIGLSSFFLANSITAWVAADEFRDAITSNSLTNKFGYTNDLVHLIGVNDALLFILILSGKYRKLAAAWAGLWLIAIIFVTGFWSTDFIEHFGIFSLLVYYAYI